MPKKDKRNKVDNLIKPLEDFIETESFKGESLLKDDGISINGNKVKEKLITPYLEGNKGVDNYKIISKLLEKLPYNKKNNSEDEEKKNKRSNYLIKYISLEKN